MPQVIKCNTTLVSATPVLQYTIAFEKTEMTQLLLKKAIWVKMGLIEVS